MIITPLQFVRLYAWIFKGSWMWHIDAWGMNARWSRGWDPQLGHLDFTCCELGERK